MATIHFLNVKQGDCSLIEHNSGHNTLIDVCNAKPYDAEAAARTAVVAKRELGISGNFQQKKYPVNPVSYLYQHEIESIFRYVQTHPDMDHMDGLKTLFETFKPVNLWDTNNNKKIANSAWEGSTYSKDDWDFYKRMRDTDPDDDPKRLTLLSGANGQFYNVGADGSSGGDGLQILAPTQGLVDAANEEGENYHRCSYVLLYRSGGRRIVFGGDSHDETWEHILNEHKAAVTDVDLLIAPHHGRSSGRSYKFLDTLSPKITFFGNANNEHLAYDAWRRRDLDFITNNQANCLVVDIDHSSMSVYATHENFARRVNPNTFYDEVLRAWYVHPIA